MLPPVYVGFLVLCPDKVMISEKVSEGEDPWKLHNLPRW